MLRMNPREGPRYFQILLVNTLRVFNKRKGYANFQGNRSNNTTTTVLKNLLLQLLFISIPFSTTALDVNIDY